MRLTLPIGSPEFIGSTNYRLTADSGNFLMVGKNVNLVYTPFQSGTGGGSTITHGSQLIPQGSPGTQVGPTAILGSAGYPGNLKVLALPSRGYWRADTPDEFSTTAQTYVYNNNINNNGGVVPAGGMVIDGYNVPGGTRVIQFCDFSNGDIYMTGSQSFVFRGCRARENWRSPGHFNCNGYSGQLFLLFGDYGGLGPQNAQYSEVPIVIKSAARFVCYRCYITYCSEGVQNDTSNGELVETYIGKVTGYYQPNPPPGETTPKHLDGVQSTGGQNNALILRNNITIPSPDEIGRITQDTACIIFGQDFGGFLGTGTNSDGTVGYQIINNFIGGGGYTCYFGQNPNDPANSARNFTVRGNRWTTAYWPNSGFYGPVASAPVWGQNGNTQSDNLWADGPNAGQSVM